jgi:crotonobetaine/carnitine-CoA ligase
MTFEHLSLDGGRTPDEVRTYADLATNANRIAAALVARGLRQGDRFALMMHNHPEFVETMIAASITATVVVPVDPRTRGEKLAFFLSRAGCRGIICADYCLPAIAAVRESLYALEWVLVGETAEYDASRERVGLRGMGSMREVLDKDVATVDLRLVTGDEPHQILYTSGTTGDPKGVVFQNARFGAAAMLGGQFGYRPEDRLYTGLSFTHGNAQGVTMGPALWMGLHAVVSRKFTKSRLWDVCRNYGCTTFSLLGGMSTAIYSEPPRANDADNPVRLVVSAGMPAAIWEAFERRFGVQVFEWYGAVEGGLALKPVGQGPIGSFGKPLPPFDMQVLDANDRPCPPGEIGEICSRSIDSAAAKVEYFEEAEASAEKTRGGWLRSGDMGWRDAEGWFFFSHRKGGGIRHNGDFVNPGFVEKVIAEIPCVTDVFVYGVPAASGSPGEKDVVAALVLDPSVAFEPKSIFVACRDKLEANFVPTYLQVVEEIPKTASEKPQERFLLERFTPGGAGIYTER